MVSLRAIELRRLFDLRHDGPAQTSRHEDIMDAVSDGLREKSRERREPRLVQGAIGKGIKQGISGAVSTKEQKPHDYTITGSTWFSASFWEYSRVITVEAHAAKSRVSNATIIVC